MIMSICIYVSTYNTYKSTYNIYTYISTYNIYIYISTYIQDYKSICILTSLCIIIFIYFSCADN